MRAVIDGRRLLLMSLVVPCVLVAPLGLPAASAGSAHTVSGVVTVTPAVAGTLHDQVTVLTGSSDWLIYTQRPSLASDVSYGPTLGVARMQLMARTRGGRVVSLGAVPHDDSWSVNGDWLVAERTDVNDAPTGHRVDMWHLTTGRRSTLHLPSSSDYLAAAAPGGAFYSTPQGTLGLARRGATKVATYGQPFGSGAPFSGVSGPNGALLFNSGSAKYVSFADPAEPRALDTPDVYGELDCTSVDASYAGCDVLDITTDSTPVQEDELVPLDGGAATVSDQCPGPGVVAGSTLVWGGLDCGGSEHPTLRSLPAGGSAPSASATTIHGDIVSAYGKAIAPRPQSQALLEVSSATSAKTLFRPERSAVSAGAFSLSGGELVDVDDQVIASRPGALSAVRRQDVTAIAGTARAAHRRVADLAPHGKQVDASWVSASAGGVAYAVLADPEQIRVKSPLGDATITRVETDTQFTLSGDRVLYLAGIRGGVGPWHLYNVATGTDIVVAKPRGVDTQAGEPTPNVALSGNNLYTHHDGYIYRENLQTGKKTNLAKNAGSSLYAAGDHVAWASSYLDIKSGAVHTVHGDGHIIGIAAAGLFLQRADGTVHLRRWNGSRDNLPAGWSYLSSIYGTVSPQLDGHVLAWINAHGKLRIASLPS